jgi:hypothetical protein
MEITPGVGVGDVRLGSGRDEVEAALGAPERESEGDLFYSDLVVRFEGTDAVTLIEVPYSGDGHEATLGGIQLTFRPIDEVITELTDAGFEGRPSDIGHDFAAGFAVWSMASLTVADIDSSVGEDDERNVVEGVSVGAPAYFGF